MYAMISEAEEESYVPGVLPAGWVRLEAPGPAFICQGLGGLRDVMVLFSVGVENDGRKWIHVSLSRPNRLPSWEDIQAVKDLFIGTERYAYQVLPPKLEHYSLPQGRPRSGYVLHLWAPVSGEPPLPNFLKARGGTL